jgi:hypothetical protein
MTAKLIGGTRSVASQILDDTEVVPLAPILFCRTIDIAFMKSLGVILAIVKR